MGSHLFFVFMVVIIVIIGALMLQTSSSLLRGDGQFFSGGPPLLYNFSTPNSMFANKSSGKVQTITPSSPTGEIVGNDGKDTPKVPSWIDSTKISPYFRKIKMTSLRAGSPSSMGHVILGTFISGDEKINVTGWQIRAKYGGIYVPRAVVVYPAVGIPKESDIILEKGQRLVLYTTISPIGVNLRMNRCIGYLNNTIRFSPSLPRQCPKPDVGILRNFSSQCENYARSIGTCQVPLTNPPIPNYDYQCREYLSQFNYKDCVSKLWGGSSFLLSEYRAWVGTIFLDRSHDRVQLLDSQGLVVDFKEY